MNVTFETGGDGSTATTHDWLTPPEILEALGPFDMDPCASQFQPWRTAVQQFTIEDDGLAANGEDGCGATRRMGRTPKNSWRAWPPTATASH